MIHAHTNLSYRGPIGLNFCWLVLWILTEITVGPEQFESAVCVCVVCVCVGGGGRGLQSTVFL